jgi:hypothetical protein
MGQIVYNSYKEQWANLPYFRKELWKMVMRKRVHVKEFKKTLLHIEDTRTLVGWRAAVQKAHAYNKSNWGFSKKEIHQIIEMMNQGKLRTVVEMAFSDDYINKRKK